MGKKIKLTESQLKRLLKTTIMEQKEKPLVKSNHLKMMNIISNK